MTGGRPIHLDLGMPSGGAYDAGAGLGQQPQADKRSGSDLADDAAQLRELLNAQRNASPNEAGSQATQARPFDLFGQQGAQTAAAQQASPAATEAARDMPQGIDQALSQMAQRLLVGDGSSGKRAVQIQLSSDTLPGVVMDVFEDGGAVIAEFTCSLEDSRERLARNAQWLADGLNDKLQRAVCVRVQTDDPEDRCTVEAHAGS